jgi:nifR3 family TIM-barrel protein
MAKVNSQGGGARLMCDAANARETVARVVDAVGVPVTVKMRLGWDRDSLASPTLAREFEQVGAAAITIHGRTRQQGFSGSVDLDGIRATVEAVSEIPVIGNGDVRTPEDAFRMRRETGCEAVAIGRGALLDPWIFRRLQRISAGNTTPFEPTPTEQIDFLVEHFRLMAEQHGDYSCTLFRKFAGWYGAKLGIPEELEDRLRRFESTTEFDDIVEQVRQRHGERETSVATALIKVPNGPVERW